MSLENLSGEDSKKLKYVVDEGLKVLQQCEDLKEGLREMVKAVAEEYEIKPAIINKAIRAAFKSTYDDDKDSLSEVENILIIAGKR